MKFSVMKKWAAVYSEALEKVSIENTGDSRMGDHSYAAWTEFYTMRYGDKSVDYSVYTGDGNDMVCRVKAMVDIGVLPSDMEGYSYTTFLNVYYNLRRLRDQIERAFEREGVKAPVCMKAYDFSVFNQPTFYNKYADKAEMILSEDAEISDSLTGWSDEPCVCNPVPKQWEMDLQKARDDSRQKRVKHYKNIGVISRKYCISFKTAAVLGTDENAYAFLADLRGALLAAPGRYKIDVEKLRSRSFQEKTEELFRLCNDIIKNDERADILKDRIWSSDANAYQIALFFMDVASTQAAMIRARLKEDITRLVNRTDVFQYQMIPELVDIAYITGMQGVYILKKELERMPEDFRTDVKKHTVLDTESNKGVTHALYVYAPKFAHFLKEKNVTAHHGNILGFSIVKRYVLNEEETSGIDSSLEYDDDCVFFDEYEDE